MTCIVGIVENDVIYMGADSLTLHGWTKFQVADTMPKVFRKGDLLIGSSGNVRAKNVLMHSFEPPAHHPAEMDDLTFIALHVVDSLREAFKAAGVAKISESVEENGGSTFLIGYRTALYEISEDWSTVQHAVPYSAIGCGQEFAYGALFATGDKKPHKRITTALEAAATFNIGCGGPFVIEELRT